MIPRWVWAVVLAPPLGLELWAVRTGRTEWTLSPQLRWVARCDTPAGRLAVAVGLGLGADWLSQHLRTLPHICPEESS
jgi:hypothetical protein